MDIQRPCLLALRGSLGKNHQKHQKHTQVIRSILKLMRLIVGEASLDDFDLATLVAEIVRILNNRPLTDVSSEPKDFSALTPHMLLTGAFDDAMGPDLFMPLPICPCQDPLLPTAMITICKYANITLNHDEVSKYCALLTPRWKQSLRSISVQVEDPWSLKCSIERLDRQNRKFAPILIITEEKMLISLCANEVGLSIRNSRDFVKMTLTRVIDCGSIRVTIFLNVTRVKSESPKIVTRVASLTRVTLSLLLLWVFSTYQ